jgi:glucose/arabinose dehydrogenase
VFPNLTFRFPISLVQSPSAEARWFVAEREGRVVSFVPDELTTDKLTALDITARITGTDYLDSQQWGITAIALHPSFPEQPELYVAYNAQFVANGPVVSVVSRFTSQNGGLTFDPASEEMLIAIEQSGVWHHVGDITFGLDDYLYIGMGDGGRRDNAQDLNDLRGAILRIDVDSGTLYGIPPDNPFVGTGFREEIFAWGLRNPWRISIDRVTGTLWLGDVGENDREEVNQVSAGGNYGWPILEGTRCVIEGCDPTSLIPPIVEYDHTMGVTITGGYIYRGSLIPELEGFYVFTDAFSRGLWVAIFEAEGSVSILRTEQIVLHAITEFAEGNDGELYHTNAIGENANIYKIVPVGLSALRPDTR